MCGIAGIIQAGSASNAEHTRRMTEAISHRGPDGVQHWESADQAAALGHCRLAIIDLSQAAAQPMQYLQRYTAVHNGEIYNYVELREELEKEGYRFTTKSDTEVILAAFDHWYDECVEHFDGMFAFAIWDQEEKELFAARDRFGEKPFYFHLNKDTLFFASEMKALWAAGVPKAPNLKMLFNFITIGYTDNPAVPEETFYENIARLPAASKLFFTPGTGELTISKYWDLDFESQNKTISDTEAVEQFSELFTTSVKRRLRSDVPIGTSLSGGLDSSFICAEIARNVDANFSFSTFTAGFPGFKKDESRLAQQLAESLYLKHQIVDVTVDNFVNEWYAVARHHEEPLGSAGIYAQFKVHELAKNSGVKVLLDGQGADEILAGYYKYYKWYWQELFQKRNLVRSREIQAARALGITEQFGISNVVASLFPELAAVILERRYLTNALKQEDLHPEFVRFQSREAYYAAPPFNSLNSRLYFNTCTHGLEELLRYSDRNSMWVGREIRLPFLSHELVEFIFSLPAHFKIRNGRTKWLLRKSMQGKVPDDITWRRDKTGFEPPQEEWMKNSQVQQMIAGAKRKLVDEKILKAQALDKPIQPAAAYETNPFDWRYLAAVSALWPE
jgi:asparagine synthase (glutamine-hydrolysing)